MRWNYEREMETDIPMSAWLQQVLRQQDHIELALGTAQGDTMTNINGHCSPTAGIVYVDDKRKKEHGHAACPGTVYRWSKYASGFVNNSKEVPCSCTCHSKKETR